MRAAAVNNNNIETDQFKQDDVAGEATLQVFVSHRIATILDDDGLAVEAFDIGQGFRQNGGLDARGEVFETHGMLRVESPRIVQRKRPERGPAFLLGVKTSLDIQAFCRAGGAFREG